MAGNIKNSARCRFSGYNGFSINPSNNGHFQLNTPLTDICDALEHFSTFRLETRRTAISLRAAELGIAETHFYMIAAHLAEVGGAAS